MAFLDGATAADTPLGGLATDSGDTGTLAYWYVTLNSPIAEVVPVLSPTFVFTCNLWANDQYAEIDVATDIGFTNIVWSGSNADADATEQLSLLVGTPLTDDVEYFWRVKVGETASGPWGPYAVGQFRVDVTGADNSVYVWPDITIFGSTDLLQDAYEYLEVNYGPPVDPSQAALEYTHINVAANFDPATSPYEQDAVFYGYFGNTNTNTPNPHIWYLQPTVGAFNDGFKIVGYGFGDTQGEFSGSAWMEETPSDITLSVVSWLAYPAQQDAYSPARTIQPYDTYAFADITEDLKAAPADAVWTTHLNNDPMTSKTGWGEYAGTWVTGGAYGIQQTDAFYDASMLRFETGLQKYRSIEATVRMTGTGSGTYQAVGFGFGSDVAWGAGETLLGLEKVGSNGLWLYDVGSLAASYAIPATTIVPNTDYKFRVEMLGNFDMWAYLNDTLVQKVIPPTSADDGYVGLFTYNDASFFRDVTIKSAPAIRLADNPDWDVWVGHTGFGDRATFAQDADGITLRGEGAQGTAYAIGVRSVPSVFGTVQVDGTGTSTGLVCLWVDEANYVYWLPNGWLYKVVNNVISSVNTSNYNSIYRRVVVTPTSLERWTSSNGTSWTLSHTWTSVDSVFIDAPAVKAGVMVPSTSTHFLTKFIFQDPHTVGQTIISPERNEIATLVPALAEPPGHPVRVDTDGA